MSQARESCFSVLHVITFLFFTGYVLCVPPIAEAEDSITYLDNLNIEVRELHNQSEQLQRKLREMRRSVHDTIQEIKRLNRQNERLSGGGQVLNARHSPEDYDGLRNLASDIQSSINHLHREIEGLVSGGIIDSLNRGLREAAMRNDELRAEYNKQRREQLEEENIRRDDSGHDVVRAPTTESDGSGPFTQQVEQVKEWWRDISDTDNIPTDHKNWEEYWEDRRKREEDKK